MVFDGKKFVAAIGLGGKNFSSEDVLKALVEMGKDKVEAALNECCLEVNNERLPSLKQISDLNEDCSYFADYGRYPRNEVELRRKIRYERNPMRKGQLQTELSTLNSWNGKHRKGRK